jgi:hypothetical protein
MSISTEVRVETLVVAVTLWRSTETLTVNGATDRQSESREKTEKRRRAIVVDEKREGNCLSVKEREIERDK